MKGYFSFNNGTGYLELLFGSNEQETMYDKVWEKIVHAIGRSGLVKGNKKVRLHSNDLPVDCKFLINKLIIVVKSVVEWSGAFYPQRMLEYDRIDVSEGIDSTCNKLVSKECWLCHFCQLSTVFV